MLFDARENISNCVGIPAGLLEPEPASHLGAVLSVVYRVGNLICPRVSMGCPDDAGHPATGDGTWLTPVAMPALLIRRELPGTSAVPGPSFFDPIR